MKFTKLMLAMLLVLAGCGKATPEAQAKKTAETFINALDSVSYTHLKHLLVICISCLV